MLIQLSPVMGRSEEMMYQVPTPLPGEHAISIVYRWFRASHYSTLESLIKVKKYNSKPDSPRRLWMPLYQDLALAFSSKYSLESFICKFTNINDYSLFLNESIFDGSGIKAILEKLSAFKFNNALNVSQDKHWRYCPICAHEDEQKYGTTYLHVSHQCFYKRVCSKHNVLLSQIKTYGFTLPPNDSVPIFAEQVDIDKDAALSGWVIDLKELPKEERKVRAFSLLHQKICIYSYDRKNSYQVQRVQYMQNILAKHFNSSVYPHYFEWGKLVSGHYPLNSVVGLMRLLEPEIHFHPMIYLMLIDVFLKRDELDMSMQYKLNMSNVKRELQPVVNAFDIDDLKEQAA